MEGEHPQEVKKWTIVETYRCRKCSGELGPFEDHFYDVDKDEAERRLRVRNFNRYTKCNKPACGGELDAEITLQENV